MTYGNDILIKRIRSSLLRLKSLLYGSNKIQESFSCNNNRYVKIHDVKNTGLTLEKITFEENPRTGYERLNEHDRGIWLMQFKGIITSRQENKKEIKKFLERMLVKPDSLNPCRGPLIAEINELAYHTEIDGAIDDFSGKEFIKKNGRIIYKCYVQGGLL